MIKPLTISLCPLSALVIVAVSRLVATLRPLRRLLVVIALGAWSPVVAQEPAGRCEQWDVFELVLKGPTEGNPFTTVTLSARFTSGGQALTVPGFYDGSGVYRIRFSPPAQGEWKYVTRSSSAALEEKVGTVIAVAPGGANHGPMRVHETFHFAYADGTPWFQVGTTCYAWTHQPAALQEQTLKTLASAPFNKLRMCIFPKSYTYNANEPANFPFVRNADSTFDLTRFDPENWQNLERRIGDLRKLGIEADIILFHPYDRWGFSEMDDATDDFYLRYAIARLGAFRNVWWSLANEYDFMIPPLRKGQKGNKSVEDFDRFLAILGKEDVFGRLRSIHHASKMYNHSNPLITHVSIQNRDLTQVLAWREKYLKPIVVDECRYEGNISPSWGKLTGLEMVRQFWVGTVAGGYVGHGETLRHPEDILWWSKGGVLHGESPARIAFLRKIMEALPYTEMTPSRPEENVLLLSKPGTATLAYALKAGPMKLQLAGKNDYMVEAIDTWNMTAKPLPVAPPGEFTFTAPQDDFLLRITVAK
ncbi:MAG: DUF5060 domain-containing protein [Luteolibacter sp.]|uniref:DUF5060 domain-containing protein n=1 Tax=Luteolibacter sp. TaxID=1962973 RepID=UPI0032647125